jgi:hypothetical protein
MVADALLFFEKHPGAVELYEALEKRVLEAEDGVTIRVQKTQITFSNPRNFACASFLPVRRAKGRPEPYLTITFGLDHPLHSPRIDAVSQPRPNRWTHHVLVSKPEEIDGELMAWVREAAAFAARKR